MIFILKQHIMNGTVTIDTMVTGIEADSFKEAKNKLKRNLKNCKGKIISNTSKKLTFEIIDQMRIYGVLEDDELEMLKEI